MNTKSNKEVNIENFFQVLKIGATVLKYYKKERQSYSSNKTKRSGKLNGQDKIDIDQHKAGVGADTVYL